MKIRTAMALYYLINLILTLLYLATDIRIFFLTAIGLTLAHIGYSLFSWNGSNAA